VEKLGVHPGYRDEVRRVKLVADPARTTTMRLLPLPLVQETVMLLLWRMR